MNFQTHFQCVPLFCFLSILSIIGAGAFYPVCATEMQPESNAERYVLAQLQKGEEADLSYKFPPNAFPQTVRQLRGSFLVALLTNQSAHLKVQPHGISIVSATVTGEVDLTGTEFFFDVRLVGCNFDNFVNLSGSQFAGSVALVGSRFSNGASFSALSVGADFRVFDCEFRDVAVFDNMRVGRDFSIEKSRLVCPEVAFWGARVGGTFGAADCTFASNRVNFNSMRVAGSFHGERSDYSGKSVSFHDSHFADFILNGSSFYGVSTINLEKMQADLISFDSVNFEKVHALLRDEMTFKQLSALQTRNLEVLLSPFDADFYSALEGSFRTRATQRRPIISSSR